MIFITLIPIIILLVLHGKIKRSLKIPADWSDRTKANLHLWINRNKSTNRISKETERISNSKLICFRDWINRKERMQRMKNRWWRREWWIWRFWFRIIQRKWIRFSIDTVKFLFISSRKEIGWESCHWRTLYQFWWRVQSLSWWVKGIRRERKVIKGIGGRRRKAI